MSVFPHYLFTIASLTSQWVTVGSPSLDVLFSKKKCFLRGPNSYAIRMESETDTWSVWGLMVSETTGKEVGDSFHWSGWDWVLGNWIDFLHNGYRRVFIGNTGNPCNHFVFFYLVIKVSGK